MDVSRPHHVADSQRDRARLPPRWLTVVLLGCAASLLAALQPAQAQVGIPDVAISSAPSPVGAGARATGIGSAFIAVADDATAASWNPGGLIQLERPEVSIVGLGAYQVDDFAGADFRRFDRDVSKSPDRGTATTARLNYVSASLPFAWSSRNVVVSVNYQEMLSFDRSLHIRTQNALDDGGSSQSDYRFDQEGSVYALSPALAVEVLEGLSFGGAFNYWFDGIGASHAWEVRTRQDDRYLIAGQESTSRGGERSRFEHLRGVNATFGFLATPNPAVSIGGVVKLPLKASLTWDRSIETETRTASSRTPLTMEYPWAAGFGTAWRASDRWLVTVDATYVAWGSFRLSNRAGTEFLVSGDSVGENAIADPEGVTRHVDGVVTVRAGIEHSIPLDGWTLALRAGGFYDPEPSRGVPETFVGGSAGLGATLPSISLDVAYQIRAGFGADGLAVTRNVLEAPDAEIDILRHSLYASLIYYL